ncbi:hypothetical protein N1851_028457 [Merluccius polli]|uniref:Uncharacterized protein n=1 Tax=Merluccius polli TaxID=89951 RepID=A0AA47M8I3_MERPO|nr:hypothetical protein N1851_028457 [Merluccius polli]
MESSRSRARFTVERNATSYLKHTNNQGLQFRNTRTGLCLQLEAVTSQVLHLPQEVRLYVPHHLVDLPLVVLLTLQDAQPHLQQLLLHLQANEGNADEANHPKSVAKSRRSGNPQEKNASNIDQFLQINLLNVEGKDDNVPEAKQLDTSVQKAGIPGFSGCVEHTSIIWHQIQCAKREGRDLHVLFLNAFGSVPHSLIWTAFNFFHIPNTITNLVRNFHDLQFCIQTTEYTTSWQSVEVGIMAGCTISPLAFTMAMEVII